MRIIIFGASITHGVSDTKNGGWAETLRREVEKEEGGYGISVYNMGVSAETTETLLKRFKPETIARQKDDMIIIFAIGTNDPAFLENKQGVWVEEDLYKKNIKKLLEQAKEFSNKIMFVGLTPIDEKLTQPMGARNNTYYYKKETKKYNDFLESFCKKNKIPFVELYNSFPSLELLDDGLHPNTEGHKFIYNKVEQKLTDYGWIG
ncbi:MAG: GDSL-type esterase/lipase family protein [Patescibacteria group bacterium]